MTLDPNPFDATPPVDTTAEALVSQSSNEPASESLGTRRDATDPVMVEVVPEVTPEAL